jgi:hypothetical protein
MCCDRQGWESNTFSRFRRPFLIYIELHSWSFLFQQFFLLLKWPTVSVTVSLKLEIRGQWEERLYVFLLNFLCLRPAYFLLPATAPAVRRHWSSFTLGTHGSGVKTIYSCTLCVTRFTFCPLSVAALWGMSFIYTLESICHSRRSGWLS